MLTCPLDVFCGERLRHAGLARHRTCASVHIPHVEYAQGAMVVNYPGLEYPFIRIHETKHASRQECEGTVLGFEFTDAPTRYYPIELPKNRALNDRYQDLLREQIGPGGASSPGAWPTTSTSTWTTACARRWTPPRAKCCRRCELLLQWRWVVDPGVSPHPDARERLLEAADDPSPPVLLASKVVTPAGSLDPGSLPIPETLDPRIWMPTPAPAGFSLFASLGRGRCSCAATSRLPLRAGAGFFAWSAGVLRRGPGLLVPSSVAVLGTRLPTASCWRWVFSLLVVSLSVREKPSVSCFTSLSVRPGRSTHPLLKKSSAA